MVNAAHLNTECFESSSEILDDSPNDPPDDSQEESQDDSRIHKRILKTILQTNPSDSQLARYLLIGTLSEHVQQSLSLLSLRLIVTVEERRCLDKLRIALCSGALTR